MSLPGSVPSPGRASRDGREEFWPCPWGDKFWARRMTRQVWSWARPGEASLNLDQMPEDSTRPEAGRAHTRELGAAVGLVTAIGATGKAVAHRVR